MWKEKRLDSGVLIQKLLQKQNHQELTYKTFNVIPSPKWSLGFLMVPLLHNAITKQIMEVAFCPIEITNIYNLGVSNCKIFMLL